MRIAELKTQTIDADHLRQALKQFDPIWDVLHMPERIALVRQVVDFVSYSPDDDTVHVTFNSTRPARLTR